MHIWDWESLPSSFGYLFHFNYLAAYNCWRAFYLSLLSLLILENLMQNIIAKKVKIIQYSDTIITKKFSYFLRGLFSFYSCGWVSEYPNFFMKKSKGSSRIVLRHMATFKNLSVYEITLQTFKKLRFKITIGWNMTMT